MGESMNSEMTALADEIGRYVLREYVEPWLARSVSFYRAEVVSVASGGKITVRQPFDKTAVALPYVSSAANLPVGSQCTVLVLGGASNAIVLGDGLLTNL